MSLIEHDAHLLLEIKLAERFLRLLSGEQLQQPEDRSQIFSHGHQGSRSLW
jgi:hypothetical protein